MIGPQIDFSAQTLRSLYGSHDNYLRELADEFDRLEAAGWVWPVQRAAVMDRARSIAERFE